MSLLKRDIGNKGEDIACKELKKNGYRIIVRNYNALIGEIDIIAKDKEYLVFVEVRLRKSDEYGTAAATVDIFKQRKIINAAKVYMKNNDLWDTLARFDVVSISGNPYGKYSVEIIKNAFEVNS